MTSERRQMLPPTVELALKREIDPGYEVRSREILSAIARLKPARILDAGCGRGFYLRMLSAFDFPTEIIGVDQQGPYLDIAKQVSQSDKRVRIVQGSVLALPFPDAAFDCVVCSEVLEHVPDDRVLLKELRRVLKPGGTLLLTVPSVSFPFLWDPINWVLMRFFGTHISKDIWWLAGIWADHERLYSADQVTERVSEFFQVKKSLGLLRWCWPFSHFILYGIGKNLVEKFGVKVGNRFDEAKQSSERGSLLATAFKLPHYLSSEPAPLDQCTNVFVEATRAA